MLSWWRRLDFYRHGARGIATFERAARDPQAAYRQLWKSTYCLLSHGAFWRERGLSAVLEENPTTDYEVYRTALEKAYAEHLSPLNGEAMVSWLVSSGSSGPPKKYPVTESYAKQVHDFHLQFFHNYQKRYPKFLRQPVFYLAAHGPMAVTPAGVPVSYISNYNYRNLPKRVRQFFAVPVAALKDEETSFRWRPLYVLASDASAFMSATPSVIVALLRQIESRGPELFEYLAGRRELPQGLPRPRVSRARLRQLVAAGVRDGKIDFAKVWPGMAFAGCWTDAVCKLQAEELRRVLGPQIPVVEMPFSATEAWFTIPLHHDAPGGAVHAATLISEFGPVGVKNPSRLLKPWELRVGEEYELYVTNRMGLVRYRMYDIVRCTGYYHGVAEVSFVRKSSQEISLGLACISETELVQALESVDSLKGKRTFFSPSENGRGLTLFVESAEPLREEVATAVFRRLCEINRGYLEEVQVGALGAIDTQALSPQHPIWRLSHSQAKPYLIRHARPEL